MSIEGPIEPSLERGVYASFRQANVTYRQGQIGSKLIEFAKLQLPNNSCLHVCDKYLDNKIDSILPDLNDPFIANESYQKYLEFVTTIPGSDAPAFPVTDKYRYRPYTYNTEIRKFYTEHPHINRVTSQASMLSRSNILPILNYNVILTPVLTGSFLYYRRFDILLRTILSNVASIEGRHQYLQFNLSSTTYQKVQFQQTFNKISYQTVRIKNDPSFYVLMHLINLLSKTATTSLFAELNQAQLDQLNLILTVGSKAIIYNLGELKAILADRSDNNLWLLVLRHINTLKIAGSSGVDISGLDDNQYDQLLDKHEDGSSVDIPPISSDATHIITDSTGTTTTTTDSTVDVKAPYAEPEPGVVAAPPVVETKAPAAAGIPSIKPTVQKVLTKNETAQPESEAGLAPYDVTKLTSVVDHQAYRLIQNTPNLTEVQKARLLELAGKYKQLTINGVSLATLLDETQEPAVGDGKLEFLKDKVVDQSMLSSSAIDLDRLYVEHMMDKDIAGIAASMAAHGMFLVNIQQKDEITILNRYRQYTFVYEDVTSRRHSTSFKLPIVSPDGTVLINGIESRMIKQQINLPICKIDSWRVSLSSNYNKTIVERIATKAHSYEAYITKYIGAVYKAKVGLEINYGNFASEQKLPYDYTCIAARYSRLSYPYFELSFNYENRYLNFDTEASDPKAVSTEFAALERKFGVFCGRAYSVSKNADLVRDADSAKYLFFGYDNYLREIDPKTEEILSKKTMTDLLFVCFGDAVTPPKQLSEWTELKILDKNFPVVYILGFEYGLRRVLEHIKLAYKFFPLETRVARTPTTIVVPFADGNLVFDRYPLEKSFVASGLLKFNTKAYTFGSFDTQDEYYTLLQDNGYSMNYLRGISAFFKFFVDPITRDVLLKMQEPTDVAGLLLRATQMLTTDDAIIAASMKNHRMRGYEQFSAILYNEIYRSFAAYENVRGNRKTFSINPEAVFQRIIGDQTLRAVEETNPMENIKDKHAFTYAGMGGRTAESFVVEDRVYPPDGVGVISEATPDSGKVALNAYLTANPVVENMRGMYTDTTQTGQENLQPSQLVSVSALVMPCSTNDEPRRANFISIQLKHHVPSQFSETNRVRTGYETVVAHRVNEYYACVAKHAGIVEEVNDKLGIIKVQYDERTYPALDLMQISNSNSIRNKFVELANEALRRHQPVYVAQEEQKTSRFKLGDIYSFGTYKLKAVDIQPLDLDALSFDYLTGTAKDVLKKAKHPVIIKFILLPHSSTAGIDIFKFGTKFSNVSGSFLKQTIVANVKAGERVKEGDVLAYNTGFFETDQFDSKQVTWKHGVMANVALIECDDTIEDSNAITAEFSRRLQMQPAHVRTLEINSRTIMKDLVEIGTEVQTTDMLCVLEDADVDTLTDSDDSAMLNMLNELNRKSPKSRFHGIVDEIDVLYSCPIEDMHPTVQAIVKKIDARKAKIAKLARDTEKQMYYLEPSVIAPGTKYRGIEFEKDTIVFLIYISETIDHYPGDKSVVMGQCKTICSTVIEKPISTVSNFPLDMLFSARSVSNRILLSPQLVGFTNRCLMKLEQNVVDKYFKE